MGPSPQAQDIHDPGNPERRSGLERRIQELERADKARQELFAVLSHELRNPLQAIQTNSALIKARSKDVEIRRPADAIDRQVQRLSKLVDDLLDVVKIAQRDDLAYQTLTLQQVVASAVEAVHRTFDTHRRELTVSMADGPLYIRADMSRLKQAIGHILANAVKFSGQQSEIFVRVFEEHGLAAVAVRDRGIGIEPQELERIFTRFEGGSSRRDVSGGLGIGLHIAREVAELHGGKVEASSEGPGKGAEFQLSLPLTADRPTEEKPPRRPYNETPPLRILVVDDNRDAADSLAMLLEMNGHTGMVAYDGAAALEKAEKTRPHVALVDIGMPTMNGYEVAQRIATASWGGETVLVAITGWGAKSDRAKSREAGFAYHLTKPVDYDTLASLLSTAVRRPGNGG
jgi:CheY-like chemotaxis protein